MPINKKYKIIKLQKDVRLLKLQAKVSKGLIKFKKIMSRIQIKTKKLNHNKSLHKSLRANRRMTMMNMYNRERRNLNSKENLKNLRK